MIQEAVFYTARELAERGPDNIPGELVSSKHLIYSSPATLAFNSPGAEGFGVKRAGLSVPGSVMLIVSPGCCGRNTSSIGTLPGYEHRFFYLDMNETDLVTGRHLKRIPDAVQEICRSLKTKPSVVMVCITCVDALLGTDMERVCRRAQERSGVRVRPCYMYALTREGRRPPMVHVRQSLYSLLEPRQRKSTSINILGYFAPVDEQSELFALMYRSGIRTIRQISSCGDYGEFLQMAEANFNLVLNREAAPAAQDLQERLGIPYIELTRLYQIDKIRSQYTALGQALGVTFDGRMRQQRAEEAVRQFRTQCPGAVFSVGEAMNGDPFELALALVRYGFRVAEIFGTLTADNFIFLKRLAQRSPDTRIYSNLDPSMLLYAPARAGGAAGPAVSVTIGKDAAWYHPDVPGVMWNSDRQPFGFEAVETLFAALSKAVRDQSRGSHAGAVQLRPERRKPEESRAKSSADVYLEPHRQIRGFRRVLTPFAPDQSGAAAVVYTLGGITVICDAGGCTGNICGFDEPRWFTHKSAVFSAGLRDMDAILGRDDQLIDKLSDACRSIDASFVCLIGTPVPAVIGTDFRALKRLASKKTGLPVLSIDTSGMKLYDEGAQKAYLQLMRTFAGSENSTKKGIGVLGAQPLDLGGEGQMRKLKEILSAQNPEPVLLYGAEGGLDAVRRAGCVRRNLVVSVSGLEAAKYLRETFGTDYAADSPLAGEVPLDAFSGSRILIVHEQVMACSLRRRIREHREGSSEGDVVCASFFMMKPELKEACDVSLREEDDFRTLVLDQKFDVVAADDCLRELVPEFSGRWISLPHFAVSGRAEIAETI